LLKFLKIQNFQSHKKTELIFSEGINVIVGESTSGKTAIFRAFQWLVNNRPLGNRFKSVFAKDGEPTSVFAEFEGTTEYGDEFVSIKKDKEITYGIGTDVLGVTDEFKGIGSDVPDSVRRLLNLDEINIQNQLDQHFLITSSSGEIAKTINRIIHLEDVDSWVSELTSQINSTNKQIKMKEEDIDKMVAELFLFPNLDDFESCISDVEKLQKEILSKRISIESLENIIVKINEVEKEKVILEEWLCVEKDLNEVKDMYDYISGGAKKQKLLENFIESCNQIDRLSSWIEDISPHIKSCIGFNSSISEISNKIEKLFKLVNGCTYINAYMKESNKRLVDCIEKYKKELAKLNACPLCFSKITKEKMDEIINNF